MMMGWWGVTAGLRAFAHRGLRTRAADALRFSLQRRVLVVVPGLSTVARGHRVNLRAVVAIESVWG